MEIKLTHIDAGEGFDFGKTSSDYARYRDIYPAEFYEKIVSRGLCTAGQRVLDLGTGTGVLPRNMYHYGASWTASDISPEQIEQAKAISAAQGMDIEYIALPAEEMDFPDGTFDVITACQCIWYFDHERLMPKLRRMLKPDGTLLLLYMAWLPFEDEIAGASEQLVKKYNPGWTGAGETRHRIFIPECAEKYFDITFTGEYDLMVPFTRESWNGRMRTCRGVGASLPPEKIAEWESEHKALLERIAPESFEVLHYAASAELKPKRQI